MKLCYCHIPLDLLTQIVREKFIQKIPTISLLKKYSNRRAKEYVGVLALLDVSETEIRKMFQSDKDFLVHFFDCRRHALEVLKGKLPDFHRHLAKE